MTIHCGTLIAIESEYASKELSLRGILKEDNVCAVLDIASGKTILASIHCPPWDIPYRWSVQRLNQLFTGIVAVSTPEIICVIIVGGINFEHTDLSTMLSTASFEVETLKICV